MALKNNENLMYVVVGVVCVFGIALVFSLMVYSGGYGMGYTEVYFEDYRKIPHKISLYESTGLVSFGENRSVLFDVERNYSFNFTVVSHEKSPAAYEYVEDWEDGNETGSFELQPGENKTVSVLFRPMNATWEVYSVTTSEREQSFDAASSWVRPENVLGAYLNYDRLEDIRLNLSSLEEGRTYSRESSSRRRIENDEDNITEVYENTTYRLVGARLFVSETTQTVTRVLGEKKFSVKVVNKDTMKEYEIHFWYRVK